MQPDKRKRRKMTSEEIAKLEARCKELRKSPEARVILAALARADMQPKQKTRLEELKKMMEKSEESADTALQAIEKDQLHHTLQTEKEKQDAIDRAMMRSEAVRNRALYIVAEKLTRGLPR